MSERRPCFTLRDKATLQEPQTREFTKTAAQALAYVYSANLHHRHLNTGQLAFIAVDIKRELQETIKPGQRTDLTAGNISGSSGDVRDIAGKIVNVSGRSVDKAEKLLEEVPDLAEQVRWRNASERRRERSRSALRLVYHLHGLARSERRLRRIGK